MSDKFREIVIRKPVTMPAVSTDRGEWKFSTLVFLAEWVIQSRGMRRDENLEHRFEWEDRIEEFTARMAKKSGLDEPKVPTSAEDAAPYNKLLVEYRAAVEKAAEGESFYVSDAAFKAGVESAKAAIDAGCEPQNRTLHPAYEPKVLRCYHALRQSRLVDENDVPRASVNGVASSAEAAPS